MNIFYNIKLGINDMLHNIGRTLITMIGIILGVMSVIVVLALVEGGRQQSIKFMEERGGALKLSIEREWSFDLDRREQFYNNRLSLEEAKTLQRYFPEIKNFSPVVSRGVRIKYGGDQFYSRLRGVLPAYQAVEDFHVETGRFITDFDVEEANKVVVLGTAAKERLFGKRKALEEHVIINNNSFQVVGIMEKKELYMGAWGHNVLGWMNRRVMVPLSTMVKKLYYNEQVHSIDFTVGSMEEVEPMQKEIGHFLRALRDGKQIFEVEANSDRIRQIGAASNKMQFIVLLVGGISLIVGGIVIANISLAAIKERLREIGVRMAVGARRRDILVQFLIQTILISIVGGVIGMILGISLLDVISRFLNSPTAASVQMIGIALVLSAGIGIFSGIFPAINASRSDPVEILRYE